MGTILFKINIAHTAPLRKSEHTKYSHGGPSQITIIQVICLGGERTGVCRFIPGKEGEIGMDSIPGGLGGKEERGTGGGRGSGFLSLLYTPSRVGFINRSSVC